MQHNGCFIRKGPEEGIGKFRFLHKFLSGFFRNRVYDSHLPKGDTTVSYRNLRMNGEDRLVWKDGIPIELTEKEPFLYTSANTVMVHIKHIRADD
ncbi:MAG: hypothetical protein NC123_15275 [Butyrivibrio sp.]|nr:hypothetical protein [Ruminococcus flavefaciens]MCM1560882.1 hypothetical protein [Butyrivibrio sp.]